METEGKTGLGAGSVRTTLESSSGTTYVVQRRMKTSEGVAGPKGWTDIATLTVPKRTQRSTILTRAFGEAKVAPTNEDRFRILDEDAAEALAVRPKEQPAPEYEIVTP